MLFAAIFLGCVTIMLTAFLLLIKYTNFHHNKLSKTTDISNNWLNILRKITPFIYALFLKFRAPGMFPPPPTYGEYSPNPKLLFSHFSASAENGGTFDGWLGYDCNSCIFNECRNFLCYGCLLLLFRFLSICSRRR